MIITGSRALALLWMASLVLTFQASASPSDEWRFEVFLDDKPIGFHHFQLDTDGDIHKLRGEARFRVKLLGFTVYDYSHDNQELWQNDCLRQIEANTDNDGKDLYVRGSSSGNQMVLENEACLGMSFDPSKPTLVYFGGGNCSDGWGEWGCW